MNMSPIGWAPRSIPDVSDANNQGSPVPVGQFAEVATRGSVPNSVFANTANINSRSILTVRGGPISAVKVAHSNWYTNNGTETGTGGVMTQTCAIEYPVGTLIGIFKYAGATQGSCASGSDLVSDLLNLPVSIPDGADFCITRCCSNTVGFAYTSGPYKSLAKGDASKYNDGTTDRTQAGSFVDDGVAFCMNPSRVMGWSTSRKDILEIGDSRSQGLGETAATQDASGDCGQVARRIGPTRAYFRVGGSGNTALKFTTDHARQVALANLAPPAKIILSLGFNDLLGATASTIEGYFATIAGLFPGIPIYLATIPPKTTSSDSWATLGNQTLDAMQAQRIALNAYIRAAVSNGYAGFVEVADGLESARDSGKWGVTGGTGIAAWTADGIHATALGDKQPSFVVP